MSSPRRGRRLLFTAVAALFCLLLIEAASFGLWWLVTGEPFSSGGVERQLATATEQPTLAPDQRREARPPTTENMVLHPYLGYIPDGAAYRPALADDEPHPIGPLGFRGEMDLREPRLPGELVIAITGGSVASMLASYGDDALREALAEQPAFAGRRLRIVNLAVGAYKQPQQLMALAWVLSLGAPVDLVLNVDGLNEFVLPFSHHRSQGLSSTYPFAWTSIAGEAPSRELLAAVGRVEYERRARIESARGFGDSVLRYSPTASLLWLQFDRTRQNDIAEAELAVTRVPVDLPAAMLGPQPTGDLVDWIAHWSRCSKLMQEFCDGHGIRYYHFLQPNQYVEDSKPLSGEERDEAFLEDSPWSRQVKLAYPSARSAGEELRREGVAFHDLSLIFAEVEEPLYIDTCCHLNRRGNELMARAIATRIGQHSRGLTPFATPELNSLECSPPSLEITRPMDREAIRAIATTVEGARLDLSAFGTTFTSNDPEALPVDASGTIEARQDGDFVISVAHGELRAEVPVRVRFNRKFDLGGGCRDGLSGGPRLDVSIAESGDIRLQIHGAEGFDSGLLTVTRRAAPAPCCGGRLWVDTRDALTQDIALEVGKATLQVPAPGAGGTYYLQVLFVQPDARCDLALSNAVALTLR